VSRILWGPVASYFERNNESSGSVKQIVSSQ
jgi:hypothetical protein